MNNKSQEEFDKMWQKIDAYFEWKKVFKVMKALNWSWVGIGIPTVDIIKEHAKELAYNTYMSEYDTAGRGGFYCGYENGELWLDFTIESCITSEL